MNKLSIAISMFLAFTGLSFAEDTADADHFGHGQKILTFQTMYGVDGPFLDEANAVRGVTGDELPWVVNGFVHGELNTRGDLRILVHGLVFADDPLVPPNLVGTNDEAEFRGLVSCLTEAGDSVETQNVVTDGFNANVHGDSFIHQRLELPNPCVAPVVMVLAGSEDKWFAITGFESEEKSGNAQP